MNKSYFSIAALLFILIFTSAQYNNSGDASVGQVAPALSIDNASKRFSLQAAHSNYVLVTFWSSANPASRIDNQIYTKSIENNSNIKYVAINLDRSEALLKQLKSTLVEMPGTRPFSLNCHSVQVAPVTSGLLAA